MNNSTAVFLINRNVRAVVGVYEPETNGLSPATGRPAPRATFKTLDPNIKVDDIVIVPSATRLGFTTNKIVETDVDVDFDSSTEMKWVVARIDKTAYEQVLKEEGEMIATIRSAEKRRKQDELRAALLKDNAALTALAISSAGGEPPVA